MVANLEVVYGAGYQIYLPTEMEPPAALALEAASQELMATKSKFQKALEAHRGVEFQVIFFGFQLQMRHIEWNSRELRNGVCLLSNERDGWEKWKNSIHRSKEVAYLE